MKYCCENCIENDSLKNNLKSSKKFRKLKECNYCNNTSYLVVELEDLMNEMLPIFMSYQNVEDVGLLTIKLNLMPEITLIEHFSNEFNPFKSNVNLEKIIYDMLEDTEFHYLLECNVIHNADISFYEKQTVEPIWENFCSDLKNNSKPIEDCFDLYFMDTLLKYNQVLVKKGDLFYRARSEKPEDVSLELMGAPPSDLTKDGRMNPRGQSFLYLGDSVELCLYEIRAKKGLTYTYCEFVAQEQLNLIDLTNLNLRDPFKWGERLDDAIKWSKFLKIFEDYISRPVNRMLNDAKLKFETLKEKKNNGELSLLEQVLYDSYEDAYIKEEDLNYGDSKLHYLPTQTLSLYIKSKGFDGIKYKSSSMIGCNFMFFSERSFFRKNLSSGVIN